MSAPDQPSQGDPEHAEIPPTAADAFRWMREIDAALATIGIDAGGLDDRFGIAVICACCCPFKQKGEQP